MRLVNYEIAHDTLLNVACEMDNVHIKETKFLEDQLGLFSSRLFEKGIINFKLLLKLIIL